MNILYIAPASYPITSSESIVNAKIAYILSNMGHKLTIYTLDDYDKVYPQNNLKELYNKNIKINTVPIKSLPETIVGKLNSRLNWILYFFKSGYYYPDNDVAYKLWKRVEKDIKKGSRYDLMITRGYKTELVGIKVSKIYNIPWIANWNDPFPAKNFPPPYGSGPFAKNTRSIQRIMKEVQLFANIHTFPSERLRNYMLLYMNRIKIENTYIIPHIAHTMFYKEHSNNNLRLKIIHAGNVGYPRNPYNFLVALSKLNNTIGYKNSVECLFVGKVTEDCKDKIKQLGIDSIVSIMSPQPYQEIVRIQEQFDLSLIIEAICDEGIYLPTKVADSIQGALPIFCVSPVNGTQHDLINKYKIGYFSDNTNVDDILKQLIVAVDDFRNNNLPEINPKSVPYFFEKYAENTYSQIFNRLNLINKK